MIEHRHNDLTEANNALGATPMIIIILALCVVAGWIVSRPIVKTLGV